MSEETKIAEFDEKILDKLFSEQIETDEDYLKLAEDFPEDE